MWSDLDFITTLRKNGFACSIRHIHLFRTRCNSLKGIKNTSIPIKHAMGHLHICWGFNGHFGHSATGWINRRQVEQNNQDWLVVSTHLKDISQNGKLPQIGLKIRNIWNHHPEEYSWIPNGSWWRHWILQRCRDGVLRPIVISIVMALSQGTGSRTTQVLKGAYVATSSSYKYT